MVSAWANSNNLVLGQLTDDILAVKETQLHLLEDMRDSFKICLPETVVEEVDCGHGRVENFSRITRIALNLLKQNKTSKLGIKANASKPDGTMTTCSTYSEFDASALKPFRRN